MEGQDFAEYALLIGFIAVLVFLAVTVLGDNFREYVGVLATAIEGW